MNQQRIDRVLHRMNAAALTQTIVSDPTAVFYLTGLRIQPGERMLALLLRTDGRHRLFVNELFGKPDCGIPLHSFSDSEDAADCLLPYLDPEKPLGIDKNWPSRFLLRLIERNAAAAYCNASVPIDATRAIKDAAEQQALRRSSATNDACMAECVTLLRPGITERQLAEQVKAIYAANGCSGVSFEPICAFGCHAADPHHANDDTALEPGMCVLLDLGGVQDDYCSDMTRTFFTAAPSEEERRVYQTVLAAQQAAEALVKPGVPLCEIDAAARDLIAAAGYGEYFTHRLGHFIGLEDHEFGDVSAVNPQKAEAGMCFSIEPGIYLPGRFGVRLEDLVLVTDTGCEVLNRYPKELTVIDI